MSQATITAHTLPSEIRALVGSIVDLEYPMQGATSEVAVVRASDRSFVVKCATHPPFTAWLQREYTVLQALAATSLPVPHVYALVEPSHAHTPDYWLLLDYVPGTSLRSALQTERDPAVRYSLLIAFGHLLAAVHQCPPPHELVPFTGTWLQHTLERAQHYLDRYPVDGTSELLQHLQQHPPLPVSQTLIHGDYTLDNVLVSDHQISGLIDWAGGAIGDPRYDVALATQPYPEAFQTKHDVDAFYSGYGGPRISSEEATYFLGLYEFF